MSSTLDTEPLGFFSLSQELRDQIVSIKLTIHDGDVDTRPTDILRLEQYGMFHQDKVTADFGARKQLKIQYPLPRLHQTSRRFTAECDPRAPSQSLVLISQKHGTFNPHARGSAVPRSCA
jgi:hypothetical protein